ncbi:MAG: formate dehydrogenase subunit gamma [Hyphomicrobium sp.]
MAKSTSSPKDGSIKAAAEESHAARPVSEARAVAICAQHGNRPDELLEILHALQHELGHVPETTLPIIATALNLSRAEVYGVLSFYHDFHRHPVGKHVIKICRAEACQSMGTEALCAHAERKLSTKIGNTTSDGKFTIEAVYCLGNCALSPAVMVGEDLYGKVDAKRFDEIVGSLDKETA